MEFNAELIRELVKKVLQENAQCAEQPFRKVIDPESGVIKVETATVKCSRVDTGNENDHVATCDVLTLEESPRLGCGIMELDHTTYAWTLGYDECDYVIEGTLDIIVGGTTVHGNQGDIIHIPKGSSIQFSTPDRCRVAYCTYPADWANNSNQ